LSDRGKSAWGTNQSSTVLRFTNDPFTAAREDERPPVTHYILLIGAEPSISPSTVIGRLDDLEAFVGGDRSAFND
jgi:hypothetical protein